MERISAVILSGGKSSRMGRDKALLEIGSKSFVDQICENLGEADELLFSVGSRESFSQIPLKHVIDDYPGCGPMAGICSSLKICRNSWLFAVGCDMPYVKWELVKRLYEYVEPTIDAVVPVGADGRSHALCAFYHRRLAAVMEKCLQIGEYRMQTMLKKIHTVYVPVSAWKGAERMLKNINTPQDYQTEEKKIPVFSVVAYSGTGKTAFLERLILELKEQGIRVAVIKHDAHEFEVDREGKDSDRFTKAGADVTGLISDTKAVLMENRKRELKDLLNQITDVDMILTEGYKTGDWPKIMLYREAVGQPMPLKPENCFAVVSDVPVEGVEHFYWMQPLSGETGKHVISEDVRAVARLLMEQVKMRI